MNTLFCQMSEWTMLKTLWIDKSNLTSVDSETLGTCINQLEDVSLIGCRLTNQQVIKILDRMSEITNLKTFKVEGTDLSTVDPHTLARAVNNVEDVYLVNTKMTKQQVNCLLNQTAMQTKLTHLVLDELDFQLVDKSTRKQLEDNLDLSIYDIQ